MTSKEMHYQFKLRLNKVDSQQNRNYLVPEIDITLNEANELYIKMIAFPRTQSITGFEKNQRVRDDIRTLVVPNFSLPVVNDKISLPNDYWHYLRGRVMMETSNCSEVQGVVFIQQYDDEFEESDFDKSSFEWREVNGVFSGNDLRFETDGSFTINSLSLSYLKRPTYIHNAENFVGGTYTNLSGTVLTGTSDCELPAQVHSEIVDLAVLLVSGEIQSPNYQTMLAKLNLNLK